MNNKLPVSGGVYEITEPMFPGNILPFDRGALTINVKQSNWAVLLVVSFDGVCRQPPLKYLRRSRQASSETGSTSARCGGLWPVSLPAKLDYLGIRFQTLASSSQEKPVAHQDKGFFLQAQYLCLDGDSRSNNFWHSCNGGVTRLELQSLTFVTLAGLSPPRACQDLGRRNGYKSYRGSRHQQKSSNHKPDSQSWAGWN